MRTYKYTALIILTLISFDTFAKSPNSGARFNLVCTGESFAYKGLYVWGMKGKQITEIYRVDLETQTWCYRDCKETSYIHAITDKSIWFESENNEISYIRHEVNRETGKLVYISTVKLDKISDDLTSSIFATCERSAFTGFPVLKF